LFLIVPSFVTGTGTYNNELLFRSVSLVAVPVSEGQTQQHQPQAPQQPQPHVVHSASEPPPVQQVRTFLALRCPDIPVILLVTFLPKFAFLIVKNTGVEAGRKTHDSNPI